MPNQGTGPLSHKLLARVGRAVGFDPSGVEDRSRLPQNLHPFLERVEALREDLAAAGLGQYSVTITTDGEFKG